MSPDSQRGRGGPIGDRLLEIVAVMLLGIATVGTAWCGLQSTLWNGEQDDIVLQVSNEQVDSSRLFGLATQAISYDASIMSSYAQAVRADDEKLQQFYLDTLVRPEFKPFLLEWRRQIQAGESQPNLLSDQEYLDSVMAGYHASQERVAELEAQASEAGATGNAYVLTTVLLAISLFFAGVTASFRYPMVRTGLLLGCILAVGLAGLRIVDLPIAEATSAILPLG